MEQDQEKIYHGSCLCGAIKYQVRNLTEKMANCHCSMCRKFHGSAYATFGEAREEDFSWTSGQSLLAQYQAENGTVRQFCSSCGSSLTFAPAGGGAGVVEFTLGSLDDDIEATPDAHIFVGSKASWVNICDGLPQFEEGRE